MWKHGVSSWFSSQYTVRLIRRCGFSVNLCSPARGRYCTKSKSDRCQLVSDHWRCLQLIFYLLWNVNVTYQQCSVTPPNNEADLTLECKTMINKEAHIPKILEFCIIAAIQLIIFSHTVIIKKNACYTNKKKFELNGRNSRVLFEYTPNDLGFHSILQSVREPIRRYGAVFKRKHCRRFWNKLGPIWTDEKS